MEILRAIFSIIGTFLTLSMSIAVLGSIMDRYFDTRYKGIWLWIGIIIAILLMPFYYIPPYDCILLDLIVGFR